MQNSNRVERLAEAIRQEAAEIIEYELEDDRISGVSVTDVKLTQDLRIAKIFVDIEGNEQEVASTLKALNRAVGFVKHQLALRLQVRKAPDLLFLYDDTWKRATRIEQLLGEEKEAGK